MKYSTSVNARGQTAFFASKARLSFGGESAKKVVSPLGFLITEQNPGEWIL